MNLFCIQNIDCEAFLHQSMSSRTIAIPAVDILRLNCNSFKEGTMSPININDFEILLNIDNRQL